MRQHGWKSRLWSLAALAAMAAVGAPMASADIDTTPAWNGVDSISSFGYQGATPTYGQTLTGTGETLGAFSVFINVPESATFQGGVGTWDGSAVSGVLWSGPDQNTSGSGVLEQVSFVIPDGVALVAGQAYVIYATSLFSEGSGSGSWGFVWEADPYADGTMVWQNGGALGSAWDGNYEGLGDLAFIATFRPTTQAVAFVPMPARGGYCTVVGNTNPYTGAAIPPGTFVDLAQAQVVSDPSYAGVMPARYVEGVGLTCDAPPAGFTQQGFAGETQRVGEGVYPYYTSAGK